MNTNRQRFHRVEKQEIKYRTLYEIPEHENDHHPNSG